MTIKDLFHETITAISSNKIRSGLTILGIVIGIGSVIALIAIGQGAQASIQSSIQSIGSNLVMVMPGSQRSFGQVSGGRGTAQTLTMEDVNAIKSEISSAKAVAPDITKRYQVTAKGTNSNTSVIGTVPEYADVRNVELESGTFISDQDVRGITKVAVIGPTTRDDLFGEGADALDQSIRINHIDFKVIGVTKSKGGTGFGNQDDRIIIPLSVAQHFLSGDNYVSTISVTAQDQNSMTQLQQDITALLLDKHNIKDPLLADFNVLNQSDIVATASSVTTTFTILLGSVAGISLLVGGIGIMNMMLTTVTERTREIGLRKAIGAKKKDINTQFLLEAIVLTFIGGLLGVLGGYLVSYLVRQFANIATSVSISSVMLAFGVSALIGIIFGYYPARRASKLNPIDALRYE
jgi:putative ABC transport system permease protein